MYRLDEKGDTKERDTSIFVDSFVMNGMGEYYLASGDKRAAQIAGETYDTVIVRLLRPGSYGTAPYEIPDGMESLGVYMIFAFFFYNLGKQIDRKEISNTGYKFAHKVLEHFWPIPLT